MSAKATLNRLEPKIIALGHAVEEIQSTLTGFDARAQVVDGIQDKVEDRLTVVEGKVEQIQDHLHLVVDTINVILKRLNKDLWCYEECRLQTKNLSLMTELVNDDEIMMMNLTCLITMKNST